MPLAPVAAWWLLLPLALALVALGRTRPAAGPAPDWRGLALGGALAWGAVAGLAGLTGGADRLAASALGGALGLAAAVLGRWRGERSAQAFALLAALGAAWALGPEGQGVPFANGALAGLAVWGAVGLGQAARGGELPRAGLGAFVATAAALGGAAWGGKLLSASGLGTGAALGVFAVALAVGAWTPEREDWPRRAGVAVIAAPLAACWLGAVYHLPWPLVALGALGVGVGALAANQGPGGDVLEASVPAAPAAEGLFGVASLKAGLALAGAGGLVVVAMRLGGSVGTGLLVAGAALALATGPRPAALARWLLALGALRLWLQLFLDRTALTGFGVDLTHPYAFAALLAGAVALPMLLAAHRLAAPDALLRWGGPLALAGVPVWLGFFWQIEALGAFLVGALVAALGHARGSDEDTLPVALVLTQATVALLAAPWLVSALDASRGLRLGVFLGGVLLALAALGHWAFWVARRGRLPA